MALPPPASASPPTAARPLRVAVLAADEHLREHILLPGLIHAGFQVSGSGRAVELYRQMLGAEFDIAVLDIGIPDEDGMSVARHLRSVSPMGIVMLTGNRARGDRIRALTEGADAFLAKPVDMDILTATLHSLARRLQRGDEPASLYAR